MPSSEPYSRRTRDLATGANALPVRNKRKGEVELNPHDLIPHFVRVKSEDGTSFRIHKVLAMYYSKWFRDRLGSESVARADDKMILGSVDNKTLVAFLEWLYKQTKWRPPTWPESGYARFTSPLDDEGFARAYIFTVRYSIPAMKTNIIERAVELFKHTEPSYTAIAMACDELSETSPFIRLLVDAHCVHSRPHDHEYASVPAGHGSFYFDSGVDLDYGTDDSTIMAMDIDDDTGNQSDSQSDVDSNRKTRHGIKLHNLPPIFVILVGRKMRELASRNIKHFVLHKFDYKVG